MLRSRTSRLALAALFCAALTFGVVAPALAAPGDYTQWEFYWDTSSAHPDTGWFQVNGPFVGDPSGPSYRWYNESFTLRDPSASWATYDSGDNLIDSGSDAFPWIKVNAGVEATFSAPVTLSREGTYTVAFSGLNGTGERGGYSEYYGIDKTRPVAFSNLKPVYDNSATITVTATDTLSGVIYILGGLDGEPEWAKEASGQNNSVEVTAGVGSHFVTYFALDGAGNFSHRQTVAFTVNPTGYVPVLSNPSVSSAKKRKVTFGGSVTASASDGVVNLTIQRKVGRKWKSYRGYSVAVPKYAGSYSLATKFRTTGTFRVRANQGAGYSPGYRTFRVR
jgi:hypothetical protein